jgi:hypothetical protein
MIAIEHKGHCVLATVVGEFTFTDYRTFEENVLYEIKFHGQPNLLIDLTGMLGYTVDVVLEELRFSHRHKNDFGQIAVVTTDQWTAWATWVARVFVEADVRVFESVQEAEAWLQLPADA